MPHESADVLHLTLEDAERIIREVAPRKAVLTHFGMTMLKAVPRDVAQKASEKLGIEIIAASDGMTLELPE
jgi:ribonuclease BN (tRNA processing enzyme)